MRGSVRLRPGKFLDFSSKLRTVGLNVEAIGGIFFVEEPVQYALADDDGDEVEKFTGSKTKVVDSRLQGSSSFHHLVEPLGGLLPILVHVQHQFLHHLPLKNVLPKDPRQLGDDGNGGEDERKPDVVAGCPVLALLDLVLAHRGTLCLGRYCALQIFWNVPTAMKETKLAIVCVIILSDTNYCILVQIVVGRCKYETDNDEHEGPLLVKGEDEVARLNLTWVEQFLHLVAEVFSNTKESRHIAALRL